MICTLKCIILFNVFLIYLLFPHMNTTFGKVPETVNTLINHLNKYLLYITRTVDEDEDRLQHPQRPGTGLSSGE